jgi:cell division protease FtsH
VISPRIGGTAHRTAPAKPGPQPNPRPKPQPPQPPWWRPWLLPVGLLITMLLLLSPSVSNQSATSLTYSDFVTKIQSGQVRSVVIDGKGKVTGALTSGKSFTSKIPTALDNGQLERLLEAKKVNVKATQTGSSASTVFLSLLPLLLLVGFFLWTGRQSQRALAGGFGSIGRSRAKLIETERPTTRFTDVAGYEGVKQEISEVVDFLRNPDRYLAAGAVGPRGVVMVGPPGTGKTLLAGAVAGEADAPFLSVTGSAFVEMTRPYSEQTQRIVDEEVARLLRQAEERAVALLRRHRRAMDHLAELLLEEETVDGAAVLGVLAKEGDDLLARRERRSGRRSGEVAASP